MGEGIIPSPVNGRREVIIYTVNDYISRGPRPQLEDYPELSKLGFTHVINLEDNSEALKAELGATEKVGIKVISIPMSEWTSPTVAQLTLSMRYIKSLFPDLEIKSGINLQLIPDVVPGKRLFVHCLHGCDRTGEVCALERMVFEAWPFEKASDEMVTMGHKYWWPPYWFWRRSIIETYDVLIRGV
jgi:protein tyrosine/serine phosphatase